MNPRIQLPPDPIAAPPTEAAAEDVVLIRTTRQGAEIIRLSLRQHTEGLVNWASLPKEEDRGEAPRMLAQVRAVQDDVEAALLTGRVHPEPQGG